MNGWFNSNIATRIHRIKHRQSTATVIMTGNSSKSTLQYSKKKPRGLEEKRDREGEEETK